MRTIVTSAALLVLTTLSACSNDGRPQFISDTGVTREVRDAGTAGSPDDGLVYQFKLASLEAKPRLTGSPAVLTTGDATKQRAFMEAGFALIQARCNRYILAKADNQRQVNVWRDTFAPVTALLTGAVALIGSGGETSNDALTALSLGTSAASAGFRIYEQRYLFGAENVNSVRLLILKALADNADTATRLSATKLSYSQSVTHLINNQAVCSPGHILQLVSQAIEAGKVVSATADSATPPVAAPASDKATAELADLKALFAQLKQDNTVSDAQVAAAKAKIAAAAPVVAPPPAPRPAATTPTRSLDIVTTRVLNE